MEQNKRRALDHTDLEVHQRAYAPAMEVFELSKRFPKSENLLTYGSDSTLDQVDNHEHIAEAWEKRRYEAAFIAKLTDSCAEVAETKDWLRYSCDCGYLERELTEGLKERVSTGSSHVASNDLSRRRLVQVTQRLQTTSNKRQATSHTRMAFSPSGCGKLVD